MESLQSSPCAVGLSFFSPNPPPNGQSLLLPRLLRLHPTQPSPLRRGLSARSARQEQEERAGRALSSPAKKQSGKKLSPQTVFQVAGTAAAVAAIVFSLPLAAKRRDNDSVFPSSSVEGSTEKPPGPGPGPGPRNHTRGKTKVMREARPGRKAPAVMPPEERQAWTSGLPSVQERVRYGEILSLHQQGKLKHIIKHPVAALRTEPNIVFAVQDDNRVLRVMLPAQDRDPQFWHLWDKSDLASIVIEAYTPPLPEPDVTGWILKSSHTRNTQQTQKPKQASPPKRESSLSSSTQKEQLQKVRKEMDRLRRQKELRTKQEKLLEKRAKEEAKAKVLREVRAEKAAAKKLEQKSKLAERAQAMASADDYWYKMSRSEGSRFGLGVFFFWLFYQTIVLGVKKKRKDYEDRVKIERAEEEERRKMQDWEEDMDKAEAINMSKQMGTENLSEEEKRKLEEAERNPQVQLGLKFMRSGAKVRRAASKRPPKYLEADVDVRFSDVAGLGQIRRELEEIVDFFTYRERYLRRGSKIPSGILLCGDPGTGKTLLAKAVAGEAGVNFFSISASQFVEIYVGVGASRVRALYQEARENAPAVVFIDELDAVGRIRGLIGGSGGQERDATLNQLLTCLDGFEGKGDVITIAATNRADILDPALVRPGRFDRKIYIPKPGFKGRIEILKVHARNKPLADDLDFDAIAAATDGMVGAQLANLLDIAALSVIRDGRTEITTDDLLSAIQLEESGLPDNRPRGQDLWYKIALNEAALAVAAVNTLDFRDVQVLNIIPWMGDEKGAVRYRPDRMKFDMGGISRVGLLDYITMQLSARAVDELWHGYEHMTTIWCDCYDNARKVARLYVYSGHSSNTEYYCLSNCLNVLDRYTETDVEALEILQTCYEKAKLIMERNRVLVDKITEVLISQKVIQKEEFWKMVNEYGKLEKPPPLLSHIRTENLKLFQEEMIASKYSLRTKK